MRAPISGEIMGRWSEMNNRAFLAWRHLASGPSALWLAGVWGFAEATFWPIIPDFLLAAVVAGCPRRFHRPLIAAVGGMMAGGVAMVLFAAVFPRQASAAIVHLPLFQPAWLTESDRLLNHSGPTGFLYQPFSGVPFKAWAVSAGRLHLSPFHVVPLFILARSVRLILVAGVAAGFARICHRLIPRCAIPLAAAYACVFGAAWISVLRATS